MKRSLPVLMASVACLAGSADLLPEMRQHLDFGHRCVRQGYDCGAEASSDLILLPLIRVYIDERGSTEQTKAAIGDAAFIWEDALENETTFLRVPREADAQVIVRFRSQLKVGGKEAGGYTEWSRSVTWEKTHYVGKLQAEVLLRTRRPDGQPMSRLQARQAALHEFGHLLGLDDSQTKGDVMGPLNLSRPITTPSRAEVQVIMGLRERAYHLRSAALINRWQ